jgi:hypothetical protein
VGVADGRVLLRLHVRPFLWSGLGGGGSRGCDRGSDRSRSGDQNRSGNRNRGGDESRGDDRKRRGDQNRRDDSSRGGERSMAACSRPRRDRSWCLLASASARLPNPSERSSLLATAALATVLGCFLSSCLSRRSDFFLHVAGERLCEPVVELGVVPVLLCRIVVLHPIDTLPVGRGRVLWCWHQLLLRLRPLWATESALGEDDRRLLLSQVDTLPVGQDRVLGSCVPLLLLLRPLWADEIPIGIERTHRPFVCAVVVAHGLWLLLRAIEIPEGLVSVDAIISVHVPISLGVAVERRRLWVSETQPRTHFILPHRRKGGSEDFPQMVGCGVGEVAAVDRR